jgi:hypothetical protein
MKRFFSACAWLALASPIFGDDHAVLQPPPVSTFSIVAIDPANGDMGVAVASRYFSVGAVVPWALAGVGAVATQANVNVGYGPKGIDLLREGLSAKQVLDRLLEGRPTSRYRGRARQRSDVYRAERATLGWGPAGKDLVRPGKHPGRPASPGGDGQGIRRHARRTGRKALCGAQGR